LKGKGKVRDELKPTKERERDERKRRFELAKARRKSGTEPMMIGRRRRPSMTVGREFSPSL
jgi:hypothetical protein